MCLGVPGRVIEREESVDDLPHGLVEFAGVRRRVCLACIPEVAPGEYVIVHAGIAISRVDEDEAQRLLAMLATMDEDDTP